MNYKNLIFKFVFLELLFACFYFDIIVQLENFYIFLLPLIVFNFLLIILPFNNYDIPKLNYRTINYLIITSIFLLFLGYGFQIPIINLIIGKWSIIDANNASGSIPFVLGISVSLLISLIFIVATMESIKWSSILLLIFAASAGAKTQLLAMIIIAFFIFRPLSLTTIVVYLFLYLSPTIILSYRNNTVKYNQYTESMSKDTYGFIDFLKDPKEWFGFIEQIDRYLDFQFLNAFNSLKTNPFDHIRLFTVKDLNIIAGIDGKVMMESGKKIWLTAGSSGYVNFIEELGITFSIIIVFLSSLIVACSKNPVVKGVFLYVFFSLPIYHHFGSGVFMIFPIIISYLLLNKFENSSYIIVKRLSS